MHTKFNPGECAFPNCVPRDLPQPMHIALSVSLNHECGARIVGGGKRGKCTLTLDGAPANAIAVKFDGETPPRPLNTSALENCHLVNHRRGLNVGT